MTNKYGYPTFAEAHKTALREAGLLPGAQPAELIRSSRGEPEIIPSALEAAVEWLRDVLKTGPVDGVSIKKHALASGISERTSDRAASRLKVVRTWRGFGEPKLWSMQ
ncbi:MAG: hypothetical protein WBX25_06200 [Rhodomicrobium sp.]